MQDECKVNRGGLVAFKKEIEGDWMYLCCTEMCSDVDSWLLVRILQAL